MYFDNCKTLDELKSLYKELVMKHHPDMGGDTKTMQDINAEHDRVFETLKRYQNTEASKPGSKAKTTTETPEEFRNVVEALLKLENISIELCGSWLWISGETYAIKDQLKSIGCLWSKSKRKWYWRHAEDGARWSRGRQTMSSIRAKYGSAFIIGSDEKQLLTA